MTLLAYTAQLIVAFIYITRKIFNKINLSDLQKLINNDGIYLYRILYRLAKRLNMFYT